MLQNTDLFIVERAGVRYKMTADQIADFVGAIRDYTVLTIAERNALTGLKIGDRIWVADATPDSSVTIGWAIYRVQSTGPNVFFKIQEQESMDLIIDSHPEASAGGTTASNPINVDSVTQVITFNITQLTALP
jgi:hypothetical protein